MTFAEIIFWICVAATAYTYMLYPILLWIANLVRRRPETYGVPDEWPMVSVIISAYNEEGVLSDRLSNLTSIDYPNGKVEILIGSDGSTDGTNEILRQTESDLIKPVVFSDRRGKVAVLNDLVGRSRGEILVFSDANTEYTPMTIKELVKPFSDQAVGAVCGELVLKTDARTAGGLGEGLYWGYENVLKRFESNVRTTLGANGAVYALRKSQYRDLPVTKAIMDDLLIPLNAVKNGFRIHFAPEAVATERQSSSVSGEFRRKARNAALDFNSISEFASLLHPRFGFVSIGLWSHKILRWFVPFFLIGMAISSLLLAVESQMFQGIVAFELAFVILAGLGYLFERGGGRLGMAGLPYYFLSMNLALLVGFLRWLRGSQTSTWKVVRP